MRFFNRIKILALFLVPLAFILQSCGISNYKGQLVGVKGRIPWAHPQPYGTIYVPTGTFHMGQSDEDIVYALTSRPMQVSIQAFFMDDTEITNNEYRQFVFWVRDSLAREILQGDYMDENQEYIDWEKKRLDVYDPEVQVELSDMYYKGSDIFQSGLEFDTRKYIYNYKWLDLHEAAKRKYLHIDPPVPRSKFIREEKQAIYPDTLVWIRDFTYSYNDPLTQLYFAHPGYDDYPVVGITWLQAKAFVNWRTNYLNDYYRSEGMPPINPFRLPTEAEWEYAARGGRDFNPYPWGGPYIRNSKGCFLANLKPLRGNYIEDGGFYPVKVISYFPNDYGLYCMAGNVAEWTDNAYNEGIFSVLDDMNPAYYYDANKVDDNGNKIQETATIKRKAIKGGSWKDVGYFLQNGVRTYEYQDTAKSYIGFRCVMTYMGRSITDN